MNIEVYCTFCGGKMVIFPENLLIMKCVFMFLVAPHPHLAVIMLLKELQLMEKRLVKEAAETLQNNFYVDDLLKSVDDEDTAIKLIKEVKAMCASGGFRLTKFLCNSKKVLQSIPEDDRRAGVKDKDLVGKLPSENTLGVHWNTETDTF